MRVKTLLGFAVSAALVAVALPAFASHDYTANVTINAAQEVPTNGSTATGTAGIFINTTANTLTYHITYSGLTSAENNAHIHGFAPPGMNAGVLHGLPGTAGLKTGTWTYLEAQEANILAGQTYINIHTVNNPGGEIRGQIVPVAEAGTDVPALSRWAMGFLGLGILVTAGLAARRRARA